MQHLGFIGGDVVTTRLQFALVARRFADYAACRWSYVTCGTHGPKLQCKTSWALERITCNTRLPQQKEARTGELNSALTQELVDLKRRATRKAAKRAAKEAEQREMRKAIK